MGAREERPLVAQSAEVTAEDLESFEAAASLEWDLDELFWDDFE
jgi:hypothetical protein